jgi:hypothetical protein
MWLLMSRRSWREPPPLAWMRQKVTHPLYRTEHPLHHLENSEHRQKLPASDHFSARL